MAARGARSDILSLVEDGLLVGRNLLHATTELRA